MSCNHANNHVYESRVSNYIRFPSRAKVQVICKRRRRVCKDCGYRWTTYEVDDDFIERFTRPAGEDELSAIKQLKLLKHKIASLIS